MQGTPMPAHAYAHAHTRSLFYQSAPGSGGTTLSVTNHWGPPITGFGELEHSRPVSQTNATPLTLSEWPDIRYVPRSILY